MWRAGTSRSVVDEVEDRVDGMRFPREYHAEVVGEATELNAAQDRLLVFGLAAAIAIFLLLHAAFGSLRLAILTFLLLPMALVGGALAVWLGDGVLVPRLPGGVPDRLRDRGAQRHLDDQPLPAPRALRGRGVRSGARSARSDRAACTHPDDRLATGLALVPLAVPGAIPGHEIEHPMAIVILGGLVTATLLNLFVLPSLYLRFGRRPVR